MDVARESTPRAGGWIAACAAAECIGMTASASAARVADGLPGAAALTIVVLGGVIEGVALGVLQAAWLATRFAGLSRWAWIGTTALIAGLGWAFASAPSALGDPGGTAPHPGVIVLLAAGLGLAMGALLGVGQAVVLRGHVPHPWRWVWISALAWMPAMMVIFTGATVPDASWSLAAVVGLGALTGLVAGAVLGLVSLALMPALTGPVRAVPSGAGR